MSPGLRISSGSSVLRHLEAAGLRLCRSLERLAGGSRIARAADDPAGLGLSERMRARLLSQGMAGRNAQAGADLARTAGAVLGSGSELLGRLAELAVRAPNGTLAAADRVLVADEWTQLVTELERATAVALPGGAPLSGPGAGAALALQVGVEAGQVVQLVLPDVGPALARLRRANPGLPGPAGKRALDVVRRAVELFSLERARLASVERRLESAGSSLAEARLHLAAAEGRLRDADLAAELAELVAARLVLESATALSAQANREGLLVLELLEAVPPPWEPETTGSGVAGSTAQPAGRDEGSRGPGGAAGDGEERPRGRDRPPPSPGFSGAKAPLLPRLYG